MKKKEEEEEEAEERDVFDPCTPIFYSGTVTKCIKSLMESW